METKVSYFGNLKVTSKNNYKGWHFWYKAIAMTFIFGVLFSSFIVDLVSLTALKNSVDQWLVENPGIMENPNFWELFKQAFGDAKGVGWISFANSEPFSRIDYGSSIIAHFSYFTVLSNLAIGFWFLISILEPNEEGKTGYVGYRMTLILTTFITITMLIWLGLLMPTDLASGKKMDGLDWFFGLTEHALFPLLFIFYVVRVFRVEGEVMDQVTYAQKEWKNMIFILLGYGIYCLIRGEIRYRGNQASAYPYFFLNIHAEKVNGLPGFAWFVIAVLLISLISFGFSSVYNKLVYINKHTIRRTKVSYQDSLSRRKSRNQRSQRRR